MTKARELGFIPAQDTKPTAHFHAVEAQDWLHIHDDLNRHDQTVTG